MHQSDIIFINLHPSEVEVIILALEFIFKACLLIQTEQNYWNLQLLLQCQFRSLYIYFQLFQFASVWEKVKESGMEREMRMERERGGWRDRQREREREYVFYTYVYKCLYGYLLHTPAEPRRGCQMSFIRLYFTHWNMNSHWVLRFLLFCQAGWL